MKACANEWQAQGAPLIEAGEAFRRLGGAESGFLRECFDVIVIGAG